MQESDLQNNDNTSKYSFSLIWQSSSLTKTYQFLLDSSLNHSYPSQCQIINKTGSRHLETGIIQSETGQKQEARDALGGKAGARTEAWSGEDGLGLS